VGLRGLGTAAAAQASLNDFLGFEVDLIVASAFMQEIVAELPGEFELTAEQLAG